MSRPRFLADEDVRIEIVLAVVGVDPTIEFVRVQDLGRSGLPDPEILEFANDHGWIVVSHDVSTMTSWAWDRLAAGEEIGGLMLAPQERTTREIADSLLVIAGASEAEEWRNQVVFLPL